jgi:hypothetical protein
MSIAAKSLALALLLGGVAWSSTQVYANYCVPPGFTGFLQSLVTMDSSPCQAVFALIQHSNTLYASMITAMLFAIFSGFTDGIQHFTMAKLPNPVTGVDCVCPTKVD